MQSGSAFFTNSVDMPMGKYAPDPDDVSTNAGSANTSPAGVAMRGPAAKRMEVDFLPALQQLDAEFESSAKATPATFHAYPNCNPAVANQGQPVPKRTRSEDLAEAVMELDGEFLQ